MTQGVEIAVPVVFRVRDAQVPQLKDLIAEMRRHLQFEVEFQAPAEVVAKEKPSPAKKPGLVKRILGGK